MKLKQEWLIFGLLGVAAVFVLWFISKENQGSQTPQAEGGPPEGTQVPSFPNVNPIPPSSFVVNGFNPDALANVATDGYQPPSVTLGNPDDGNGCNCDNDCDPAGIPVSVQKIPQSVYDQSVSDLASYKQKMTNITEAGISQGVITGIGGTKAA